jgi:hypothetical protein
MEIPKVLSCSVNECAFNSNKECHALAINVGGAPSRMRYLHKPRAQGGGK